MEFPRYARCQVSWKIQNLTPDLLTRINFPNLESQVFIINIKNHKKWLQAATKWKLMIFRNRTTLSLYIEPAEKYGTDTTAYRNYQNLTIKYAMKLKDVYGHGCKKQKGIIEKMCYYDRKRLGRVISLADFGSANNWRYYKDKSIEIIVDLDLVENISNTAPKSTLDKSLLSSSFESMYNNEKYSDYTLVTADEEEIPVHKNVLSSRSKVFERMIETELKEGEEKRAKIDDIDSNSLKEFLRFVYCGRVNNISSVAVDLIYAAEKYDLKDLKPLCVQSMIKTMSVDTAIDTFILADLHQERDLKAFTLDFILWNYESLKNHESWDKLSTTLYKEILDYSAANNLSNVQLKLSTLIKIAQPAAAPVAQPAQNQQQPALGVVRNPQLALNDVARVVAQQIRVQLNAAVNPAPRPAAAP